MITGQYVVAPGVVGPLLLRTAPTEFSTLICCLSVIGNPAPLEHELHDGKDEYRREEHQGDRRRVAHLEGLESDLVDVQHERGRSGPRTAIRHDQGLIEDLEGGDDGDD